MKRLHHIMPLSKQLLDISSDKKLSQGCLSHPVFEKYTTNNLRTNIEVNLERRIQIVLTNTH